MAVFVTDNIIAYKQVHSLAGHVCVVVELGLLETHQYTQQTRFAIARPKAPIYMWSHHHLHPHIATNTYIIIIAFFNAASTIGGLASRNNIVQHSFVHIFVETRTFCLLLLFVETIFLLAIICRAKCKFNTKSNCTCEFYISFNYKHKHIETLCQRIRCVYVI